MSQLDQIEARLQAAPPGAITITPSDVNYLLTLARKQAAALDKVRQLHAPTDAVMYAGNGRSHMTKVCTGCGTDDGNWQRWPCPTVAALEPTP